jgi:hypothetical protein
MQWDPVFGRVTYRRYGKCMAVANGSVEARLGSLEPQGQTSGCHPSRSDSGPSVAGTRPAPPTARS